MSDFVPWLRGLAEKGGKGVVNNIDARCLGRIADELERLTAQEKDYRNLTQSLLDMGRGERKPRKDAGKPRARYKRQLSPRISDVVSTSGSRGNE